MERGGQSQGIYRIEKDGLGGGNWCQLILWDCEGGGTLSLHYERHVQELIGPGSNIKTPCLALTPSIIQIRLEAGKEKVNFTHIHTVMTGRDDISEGKSKVKILAPTAGNEKSGRFHGPTMRSKGFAITDLLGLEAELQPPSVSLPSCEGHGGGIGGVSLANGSLPLGLGFLCGFASQQPTGTTCLLPTHIPFLQPRADHQYLHNTDKHKENISGKIPNNIFELF